MFAIDFPALRAIMKSEVNFMSDHFDKRRKLNMIKPGIAMLGINFLLTVCGAIANLLSAPRAPAYRFPI